MMPLRRTSLTLPLVTATLAACGSPTATVREHWAFSKAYLELRLTDDRGNAVASSIVRVFVSRDPSCQPAPTGVPLQVPATGRLDTILNTVEPGPFDACLTFAVTAPSGLRDTTVAGVRVWFGALEAPPTDTARVTIVVPR